MTGPITPPEGTTELGIDIIKVARIRDTLARFGRRFSGRVLTPSECKLLTHFLSEVLRQFGSALGTGANEFTLVQTPTELGSWRETAPNAAPTPQPPALDPLLKQVPGFARPA